MLYANVDSFGGDFFKALKGEFTGAKEVSIATGYVSFDVIKKFYGDFERIANSGGTARLLLGMAFYEGLTLNKLNLLRDLSRSLEASGGNENGVFVSYSGKYHGKVYFFDSGEEKRAYMGSSNFSRSGLSENIECTALIQDQETKRDIGRLIDYLFDPENAAPILKAEITVPGSEEYKKRISLRTLADLQRHDPTVISTALLPKFAFSLSRVADKEKSSLNVYFGRGRWSRSTGKVAPRAWYEVELIAPRPVSSDPAYPKGDFTAFTDDGYIMPMKTSGDYHKNIRSRGNLKLLGQWIKGKLQKNNILLPFTPVTQDTLDAYGKDSIKFYKIRDAEYYMEF